MAVPQPDNLTDLEQQLRQARQDRAPDERILALADTLKAAAPPGEFTAALRRAWPDLRDPIRDLSGKRRRLARRRKQAHQELPCIVSDGGLRLYGDLSAIARAPIGARSHYLEALSVRSGKSVRTLQRMLAAITSRGMAALRRKPRSDRGKIHVAEEVRQAFMQRRLDPAQRQEPVQVSIDSVKRQFPDLEVPDHSLRRLERSIPKVLLMSERKRRATFEPTGEWDVPHPNHTQAFDMTTGDLFVWDRDPNERPYRPHLTAIVDERTQACLFGLYTKEAPSRAVLQALLLHAWLPKPDVKWPMCGRPLHIHCDNGKVQISDWLRDVCKTLSTDLGVSLDVRHAQVQSPWQQGHIERFFGIVHTHFECQHFAEAYCGRSPEHRREGFKGNEGRPRDWQDYPTLETLNCAFHVWIPAEYHAMKHRRLKMTRLEAWQAEADGHVRYPDRDYLYQALLQRAGERKVSRGQVQVNGYIYEHELLQGHEQGQLEVRWDPADLSIALVLDVDGQPLCWARRREKRFVDAPASLAEHREEKRRVRRHNKALKEAVEIIAPTDQGAFKAHVAALHKAHEKQVVPFPGAKKVEKPQPDDDIPFDEYIRTLNAMADAQGEKKEDRVRSFGREE